MAGEYKLAEELLGRAMESASSSMPHAMMAAIWRE